MRRKAILHIGPMKTGSTSIQLWLHQRANELAEQGYHCPTSLGSRNMSRLTYMAQAQAFNGALSATDGARLDALRGELAGLPPGIHTVIFSGEMIGQILNEAAEVQALKTMLDEFFDDYLVVVYLRRQDEMSLSRYNTSLRRGEKRARPFSRPFDYELRLNLWSEVFGGGALRVRMFDREAMPGQNVVNDFRIIRRKRPRSTATPRSCPRRSCSSPGSRRRCANRASTGRSATSPGMTTSTGF